MSQGIDALRALGAAVIDAWLAIERRFCFYLCLSSAFRGKEPRSSAY